MNYAVIYKYEIGEIIRVYDYEDGVYKAEVVSHGTDSDGNDTTTIRYEDGETEECISRYLACRANLPLRAMMEMAEGLVSLQAQDAFIGEDDRDTIMKVVGIVDRMVGESASDNLRLFDLPSGETLVVLEEEYGYRRHFWFPGMTPEELVAWWSDLATVDGFFFNPANTLPGRVITAETHEEMSTWNALKSSKKFFSGHIHTDGDSGLTSPDGTHHRHKGFRDDFYDAKPGDTCAWVESDPKILDAAGVWHYGHYDDNLEIVDDGTDLGGVNAVLDVQKKRSGLGE